MEAHAMYRRRGLMECGGALDAYAQASQALSRRTTTAPNVLYGVCHPPANDQCSATYMPYPGEHGNAKSRRVQSRMAG